MRESLKDGYGGVYFILFSALSIFFYVSKESYDVDWIWSRDNGLSEILTWDPEAWILPFFEAFSGFL